MTATAAQLVAVVLIYPGCIVAEVAEVATRLRSQGAEVHWASPDGTAVVDESGLVLTSDTAISEFAAERIDALIVPGGDPASIMGNRSVRAVVARTAQQGLVAGICAGVLVLADAGVLTGRRITHNYRPPWADRHVTEFVASMFEDVTVEGDRSVGVVEDDNVITALPNAAAEFSVTVCRRLGLYDSVEAAQLVRHLRGEFVPAIVAGAKPLPATSDVEVSQAVDGDLDELAALQVRLFSEDAGVYEPFVDLTWSEHHGAADFAELLGSNTALVLVARSDGQAVGFLAGYLSPPTPTRQPVMFAILRSLYVLQSHRQAGAGAALTQNFVAWATSQGAVEAHVSAYVANQRAHRLYEQLGFQVRSATRVRTLSDPSTDTD